MRLKDHAAIVSKNDSFRVDPRMVKIEEGFNPRDFTNPDERAKLDRIKASIKDHGVEVPLEIRMIGDNIYVVAGHRRLTAVMELIGEGHEIDSVPAIAEPRGISDAERAARLYTSNSGEPLTVPQCAEIVRRLLGYGWARSKMASYMGVGMQTIANWELYLEAPHEVKEAVKAGEVSASNAVAMVRSSGAEGARETLKAARATASAKGKARVTAASLAPSKPKKAKAPDLSMAKMPRDMFNPAAVSKALQLLAQVVQNDYDTRQAAIAYGAGSALAPPLSAGTVANINDWLIEFQDRLVDQEIDNELPGGSPGESLSATAPTS